jgi:Icc protein
MGCEWLDNLGVKNADEFWRIVSNYPSIHTIVYGHVHQESNQMVGSINCLSVPSTCIQFKPHQDAFGLDNIPPGYRWIDLYDDHLESGIIRVAKYVGDFDKDAKGY